MSEMNLKAALTEVEKGKSFCLESKGDIEKVLRALMGEKPKPATTYSVGDTFQRCGSGAWMLAKIGSSPRCAALIDLRDGIRWNSGAEVASLMSITQAEFADICGGAPVHFTKREGEWTWKN